MPLEAVSTWDLPPPFVISSPAAEALLVAEVLKKRFSRGKTLPKLGEHQRGLKIGRLDRD